LTSAISLYDCTSFGAESCFTSGFKFPATVKDNPINLAYEVSAF